MFLFVELCCLPRCDLAAVYHDLVFSMLEAKHVNSIDVGVLISRSQVTGETCKQHARFEETAQTTSG